MWQVFRDKVIEGENMFVPKACIFKPNNKKWKRPLSMDLRNMNKDKKHIWNSFIKTEIWLFYSNTKE